MQSINQLLDNDAVIKRVQNVIITLFILLIAFDIYLAIDESVDNDTISNIIKSYTDDGLYILTFFWGLGMSDIKCGQKLFKSTVHLGEYLNSN